MKIPDLKYSDLGIRLYGPETIHVSDLQRILFELKNLGVDSRFKHFYFNTLSLEGSFDPQLHKWLKCVEKVERVLSLEGLEELSVFPKSVAGYKIERYPCDLATRSAELLQLNKVFHKSKSLDTTWMEKQYFNCSGDHQILLFIVRSPDGKIVGFADAFLDEPNEAVVMQRNTFVSAEHRNLGIGGLLKSELIKSIANSKKRKWVIAHNELGNSQMTRISQSLGFHTMQMYKRIEGDL